MSIITRLGKFLILKLLYPWQYKRHCNRPILTGKVIILEVRRSYIGNSLKEVYKQLDENECYNVNCHFLRESEVSRIENIKNTLKFLKDMATAEYVFLSEDNNCFACFDKRPETTVVQLWHGCGAFKRFGLSSADLKFGGNREQQEKYPSHRNLDLVTVSSPEVIWAYEEAMGVEPGVVQATGISRTDVFFDKEYINASKERVYSVVPECRGKKIMFYAPTFRKNVSNAEAPDKLDLINLKKTFDENYILLIKHHPLVKELPVIPDECNGFAFDVTNILNIDDLICSGDICVSDYSSLIFEYALFEKPIIFFAYDLDEYNDWRGFYYDYDELTPGPVVKTTQEVVAEIKKAEAGFDSTEIIKFRKKFMSSCDGRATDRILKRVGLI